VRKVFLVSIQLHGNNNLEGKWGSRVVPPAHTMERQRSGCRSLSHILTEL
jgi:hypothetical protein